LFTAPSLERKGVAAYTRDRVLRLGVPYVVYVLVVQPTWRFAGWTCLPRSRPWPSPSGASSAATRWPTC
jgi:uncharacterized membrane protein